VAVDIVAVDITTAAAGIITAVVVIIMVAEGIITAAMDIMAVTMVVVIMAALGGLFPQQCSVLLPL
jgi:hypothetical protein